MCGGYIDIHMKQVLIEIDDRSARDLERVAPVKQRKRAEFIRLAIRRAIDLALDRKTEAAYRSHPLAGDRVGDLEGWDADNGLAVHAKARRKRRAA
jgi:hypothetical protein